MRRFRAFGLVLIVLCSLRSAVALAADLPTAEAVLKIHRENKAKLSQLHLQCVHHYETTEAHCRFAQKQADDLERDSKLFQQVKAEGGTVQIDGKPVEGAALKNLLEMLTGATAAQDIKRLRMQSKPFRTNSPMEFFIRGNEYQLRTPLSDPKDAAELQAWKFPEAPLSAKSLLKEYRSVSIYSRSAKTTPAARRWPDSANCHAYITEKHAGDLFGSDFPPFTIVARPTWDNWHPYDGFFSQPAERYTVVREEMVDGRLLTVVEVDVPLNEDVRDVWRYRAWLDLKRGALPIKMFYDQVATDKPRADFDKIIPRYIATTEEIKELPGGAFFPSKTTAEDWRFDSSVQLNKDEWAEIHAGKRKEPMAVDTRQIWDCSLVDNQPQFTEDFFVLPFPEDQQLYDHDAHKMVGELERQPLVKVGQPAPPLTISHWLDGKPRTLADLKGQVVVLDFWGLWCGPCRASIPKLKAIQAQFPDRPVTFIAIHNAEKDPKDLAARIAEFQQKNEWRFIAAIDSGRMIEDSVTSAAYGMKGFPTTVIIGADGKIVYVDPDLEGPECDDPDPEKLAAFEKEANALMKSRFEAVGETWPINPDLDEKEQTEIFERAERRFIILQIETALKNAPR